MTNVETYCELKLVDRYLKEKFDTERKRLTYIGKEEIVFVLGVNNKRIPQKLKCISVNEKISKKSRQEKNILCNRRCYN